MIAEASKLAGLLELALQATASGLELGFCVSCNHERYLHEEDGCTLTVFTVRPGADSRCPCARGPAAKDVVEQ